MQSDNWSGGSLVRLAASRVHNRRAKEEGGDTPASEDGVLAVPVPVPMVAPSIARPFGNANRTDHAPHVNVSAVPRLREYLEAFVESELDPADEEIVREHLRICAECEGYVDGLRAGRGARYRAIAAANALIARFEPAAEKAVQCLPAAPSAPAVTTRPRKPMLMFACVSTCLALFLCVTVVPLFQQIRVLHSRVGSLQTNNSTLQKDAEAGRTAAEQLSSLKEETDNLKRRYTVAQSAINRVSVDVAGMHAQGGPPASGTVPMSVRLLPMQVTAPALVAISDGAGQVTVSPGGRLQGLGQVPSALRQYVRASLKSGRCALPSIARFAPPVEGFAALTPAGSVAESDRPTFRWRPVENGAPYAVSVIDGTGAIVARGQGILGNEWSVPNALQRGKTYTWEVVARGVTAPGGQVMKRTGKFTVLDLAGLASINHLRTAHADSNLIVGMACAEAGLLESAAKEFQILAEANPGSPVVQKLSRQLSPWRAQ
jgi:hypothetical protein